VGGRKKGNLGRAVFVHHHSTCVRANLGTQKLLELRTWEGECQRIRRGFLGGAAPMGHGVCSQGEAQSKDIIGRVGGKDRGIQILSGKCQRVAHMKSIVPVRTKRSVGGLGNWS